MDLGQLAPILGEYLQHFFPAMHSLEECKQYSFQFSGVNGLPVKGGELLLPVVQAPEANVFGISIQNSLGSTCSPGQDWTVRFHLKTGENQWQPSSLPYYHC
jgi:hypothetical protein